MRGVGLRVRVLKMNKWVSLVGPGLQTRFFESGWKFGQNDTFNQPTKTEDHSHQYNHGPHIFAIFLTGQPGLRPTGLKQPGLVT